MSDIVHDVSAGPDTLILRAALPGAPADVFPFFTEPAKLTRWWPSAAETDPRTGGSYHLSWPQMDWHLRGTYGAVESGALLEFTWKWDHEPDLPERTVRVEFAAEDGGTRLTVHHGTYGDGDAEQEDRNNHHEGWTHFLGQLAGALGGGEGA